METIKIIALFVAFGVFSWGLWFCIEIWRMRRLKKVASDLGFTFSETAKLNELQHPDSRLFEVNADKQYINVMSGEYCGVPCEIFGFSYWVHQHKNRRRINQTIFVFESSKSFSFVECMYGDKNSFFLLEKTPEALDIQLNMAEFDSKYRLQGKDVKTIKKWFRKVGADIMFTTGCASMAWQGSRCMFYVTEERVPVADITSKLKTYHDAFTKLEAELP